VKKLLLFGAGKSATVLIDFLIQQAEKNQWKILIADTAKEQILLKTGSHPSTEAIELDITNAAKRGALVQQADIVISLMPPSLHYLIAEDCILYGKNLLTASYLDEKIKNINVEDLVITHNNTISSVYALTKRLKKKSIIKIAGDEIICGYEHKWFVYDVEKNEFYFEQTLNIDKKKHKLVKNYLAFLDALIVIKKCNGYELELESGEIIFTNPEHKFAVYNRDSLKFEMIETKNLECNNHTLVNTFKL
jgi:hypothetical protein